MPESSSKPKSWVGGLTTNDKEILIKGGWLNHELVNAGQRLIKRQFTHVNGLQDVAIRNTLCFDIQTEEFI